jgi:hypothetical protein
LYSVKGGIYPSQPFYEFVFESGEIEFICPKEGFFALSVEERKQ